MLKIFWPYTLTKDLKNAVVLTRLDRYDNATL